MKILVLVTILVVIFIVGKKKYLEIQYNEWKTKIEGVHDYDDDSIRRNINEIAEKSFQLTSDNLPYGRSKWFLQSEDTFTDNYDTNTIEFFGYSPVRSLNELEFKEYGILLTQSGIFYNEQIVKENSDKKGKEFFSCPIYLPFKGLWKVKYNSNNEQITFYYDNLTLKTISPNLSADLAKNLSITLNKLIDTGYTYDLSTGYIEKMLVSDDKKINIQLSNNLDSEVGLTIGVLGSINNKTQSHFHTETINSIVNNPQGHGFAAEYANNLSDKFKHPFKKVTRIGQDNAKNGADRIVGNINIQTKYLSSASNSVNAAFESKNNGGMYRYKGMQLEVPKDQYNDAITLMKQKIANGKVEGHTNLNDAYKIIRKGQITWSEAKLIAKAGNLVSYKI